MRKSKKDENKGQDRRMKGEREKVKKKIKCQKWFNKQIKKGEKQENRERVNNNNDYDY